MDQEKFKHPELLEKMTLEQKAAFLSGRTVWQTRGYECPHIPELFLSDGPHGIRKQAGAGDHLGLNASLPSTCFPTAATMANSWDEALAQEVGKALGQEANALDVHILLGPGLNIKRSPLCGRNFEYFSEDPYLSGKMAAAYVKGIQDEGVYACLKHFAVNNQELRRMAMNAVLDERTLREIYLTGFEIAVKEGGAKAIMSSYNEVNGVYANENLHLLQEILREEWGFDGIVITDWGGSNDHVKGVTAGSDLEMPAAGLDSARELLQAVNAGILTERELNRCVDRLLDAVLNLTKGKTDKPSYEVSSQDKKAHHKLAHKAALESAVLLKNEGNILPLAPEARIAVIGDFAVEPRYQGAGSSMVNPTMLESVEKVISAYDIDLAGICRGYSRLGKQDAEMERTALELASTADIVLYFFGLDELSESEGIDRTHMRIPQNQVALLQALKRVNPNIVGILSAGSVVEMPWADSLKAILHGYLNGQAGAGAILDLLVGKSNPCGKLGETYPVCYEDTPAFYHFPSVERNAQYRESIYVGYRYYDTAQVAVRYPFGYGLSYTSFSYSDLEVDEKGVSFTLTNSGQMDGAETAQLYIGRKDSGIFRPAKELKGFQKVFLKKAESKRVSILFDDKSFRYWNILSNNWETEGGAYQIFIGASSADIRLKGSIVVAGETASTPYKEEGLPSYYTGKVQKVADREFRTLLGHEIPDGSWNKELGINDAICQMCNAKSRLARWVCRRLEALKKKSEEKGKPNLNVLFIYNMPFRAMAKMTGGAVSMEMARGMVQVVNGHFLAGAGRIIKGYIANKRANKAYETKLSGKCKR